MGRKTRMPTSENAELVVDGTSIETSTETSPVETSAETPRLERRRNTRLTSQQKSEVVAALDNNETGASIAERYGVSVGSIYSYRRKVAQAPSSEPRPRQESELRGRLVSFAVRTLLGQTVEADERAILEQELRSEFVRMVAAGI